MTCLKIPQYVQLVPAFKNIFIREAYKVESDKNKQTLTYFVKWVCYVKIILVKFKKLHCGVQGIFSLPKLLWYSINRYLAQWKRENKSEGSFNGIQFFIVYIT